MMNDAPDDFIYDLEEKLTAMKAIRQQAGWTQQQMADRLGLNKARISQLEAGEWRKSEHIRTFIQLIRLLDHLQLATPAKETHPDILDD